MIISRCGRLLVSTITQSALRILLTEMSKKWVNYSFAALLWWAEYFQKMTAVIYIKLTHNTVSFKYLKYETHLHMRAHTPRSICLSLYWAAMCPFLSCSGSCLLRQSFVTWHVDVSQQVKVSWHMLTSIQEAQYN